MDDLLFQQRQVLNLFERVTEPFTPNPDINFEFPDITVHMNFLLYSYVLSYFNRNSDT